MRLPTQQTDYYEILEIDSDATIDEIHAAYKKLAKIWHPDTVHEEDLKRSAEEQFKVVKSAYEILSNPLKRRNYDRENGY